MRAARHFSILGITLIATIPQLASADSVTASVDYSLTGSFSDTAAQTVVDPSSAYLWLQSPNGHNVLGIASATSSGSIFTSARSQEPFSTVNSFAQISQTITNNDVMAMHYYYNAYIAEGRLSMSTSGVTNASILQAQDKIDIRLNGTSIRSFTSTLLLTSGTATLTSTATGGNALDWSFLFAQDQTTAFNGHINAGLISSGVSELLDLGVWAPGASFTLDYNMYSQVIGQGYDMCEYECADYSASISDPAGVSGIPGDITSTAAISVVPEPEISSMLLAGLGLIGFSARRRKVAK